MNQVAVQDYFVREVASFQLTHKGLIPIGTPTFEQWEECGRYLHKSSESIHFLIGDWMNYGGIKYGKTYLDAAEELGFSVKTLQNDRQIADDVPSSIRHPELSFSHHKLVAKFDEDEQQEYLQQAAEKKMSTRDLDAYIKKMEDPFKDQSSLRGENSGKPENEILKYVKKNNSELMANLTQLNLDDLTIDERVDLFISLEKTANYILELKQSYAANH